jgi:hypothetical protein
MREVLIQIALSVVLIFVIGGAILACASNPTVPQTFNQLLLTAGTVDDAVVVATDSALKAKAITVSQAQRVANITDGVQASLVTAKAAYALGQTAAATNTLASANAALTKAQACITAPATIDACLGGAL